MNRIPVISSSVASVGYEAATLILEVEFRNGSLYQYFDVPEHVYETLMASASVGSALHALVKSNYRYTKL